MKSIIINGRAIAITLIRTARRTIQLKIVATDRLEIRAPHAMPLDSLRHVVASKQDWLTRHLSQSITPPTQPYPSHIILRGREYPLLYRDSDRQNLIYQQDHFILSRPPATSSLALHGLIESYYREYARKLLSAKTEYWATRIGVTYNRITIKSQKTRWGSCSAKGNLNYNWHIICADESLIDYIVIHELCHLRHLDHSAAFWSLVAKYDPAYPEHRRQLNRIGHNLMQVL